MFLLKSKRGQSTNPVKTVVGILIAVTIIPIALVAIAASLGNFSATEQVIIGLVGLFLALGVAGMAAKSAGIKIL